MASFTRTAAMPLVVSDNTFDAAVGEWVEDIEVPFAIVTLTMGENTRSGALDSFVGKQSHAVELSLINRDMCVFGSHGLGCMLSKIILKILASSGYLSLLKLCSKLRRIRNNM